MYSLQKKKGKCPKLDVQWVGPCIVLERIGEVVYRVQLPPRGRKLAVMPALENEAGHGLRSLDL